MTTVGVPVAATASTVRGTSAGRTPRAGACGGSAGGGHRLDRPEHVGGADAAVERLLGGGLDGGAVHDRVAVGQPDLDHVAAGPDHRPEPLDAAPDVREAGREVPDER